MSINIQREIIQQCSTHRIFVCPLLSVLINSVLFWIFFWVCFKLESQNMQPSSETDTPESSRLSPDQSRYGKLSARLMNWSEMQPELSVPSYTSPRQENLMFCSLECTRKFLLWFSFAFVDGLDPVFFNFIIYIHNFILVYLNFII